jgi:hypothetical protein
VSVDEIKRAFLSGRADGLQVAAKQLRMLASHYADHARAIAPALESVATVKSRVEGEPLLATRILEHWLEHASVLERERVAREMADMLERVSARIEAA